MPGYYCELCKSYQNTDISGVKVTSLGREPNKEPHIIKVETDKSDIHICSDCIKSIKSSRTGLFF